VQFRKGWKMREKYSYKNCGAKDRKRQVLREGQNITE
jgi:hypothetical protein